MLCAVCGVLGDAYVGTPKSAHVCLCASRVPFCTKVVDCWDEGPRAENSQAVLWWAEQTEQMTSPFFFDIHRHYCEFVITLIEHFRPSPSSRCRRLNAEC